MSHRRMTLGALLAAGFVASLAAVAVPTAVADNRATIGEGPDRLYGSNALSRASAKVFAADLGSDTTQFGGKTISGHANSIDCSVPVFNSQGCERLRPAQPPRGVLVELPIPRPNRFVLPAASTATAPCAHAVDPLAQRRTKADVRQWRLRRQLEKPTDGAMAGGSPSWSRSGLLAVDRWAAQAHSHQNVGVPGEGGFAAARRTLQTPMAEASRRGDNGW